VGVLGMTPRVFTGALTPDEVFAGAKVSGPVVIYDDEHYFMAGALAERLAVQGHDVTYVTPQNMASAWTVYTDEQGFVQARLIEAGVKLAFGRYVTAWADGEAQGECAYTGQDLPAIACGTLILATGRVPVDGLYHDLVGRVGSLARVGDCLMPSSMADAIYSAHSYARELGEAPQTLRRERPPHRGGL
jgi:dimethylamine/trimethylamine dehydrogenase